MGMQINSNIKHLKMSALLTFLILKHVFYLHNNQDSGKKFFLKVLVMCEAVNVSIFFFSHYIEETSVQVWT